MSGDRELVLDLVRQAMHVPVALVVVRKPGSCCDGVELGGVVLDGAQLMRLLRQLAKLSDGGVLVIDSAEVVLEVLGEGICIGPGRGCACCHLDHVGTSPLRRRIRQPREDDHPA